MIHTFPVDVTEILTRELVGKTYRYCTYNQPIMQEVKVLKKRVNATLTQFRDNPNLFGYLIAREKNIGNHSKYEESKILCVWVEYDDECGPFIMAELENGKKMPLKIK